VSSYVGLLSYVFDPTAQTINFASQPGFQPQFLKAITNQTRNTFIYLPGITGYGGTFDAFGTTLTLAFNTATQAAGDTLLFQYDDQQDALNDLVAMFSGRSTDPDRSQNGLGATVVAPNIEDLLRSLIAETRMNSMMFIKAYGADWDFDGVKQTILENMRS